MKWNEATWYSKLAATILFLGLLPVLAFYIGTQYQEAKALNEITTTNFSADVQTIREDASEPPVLQHDVTPSEYYPPGLETEIFAAVDARMAGVWEKEVLLRGWGGTSSLEEITWAEGWWYAKEAWPWIAWKENDGRWKVLVGADGFYCDELETIPAEYEGYFYEITHEYDRVKSEYGPYCFSR